MSDERILIGRERLEMGTARSEFTSGEKQTCQVKPKRSGQVLLGVASNMLPEVSSKLSHIHI